jgi:hypothetical protein
MTTSDEAFEAIRAAHRDSADNLLKDRAAAGADIELVRRINRNHKLLVIALLDAASDIMDANNDGVTEAYAAVKAARAEVTRRRKAAEHIVNIVSGVSDTVGAVNVLIDKLND